MKKLIKDEKCPHCGSKYFWLKDTDTLGNSLYECGGCTLITITDADCNIILPKISQQLGIEWE